MLPKKDDVKMTNNDMTYNIQQVAAITGLSKQVIRKWEERYGIVQPKRLDNGYRIYCDEEVQQLLYVKSLVEKGQSVKQAALHLKEKAALNQKNLNEQMDDTHSWAHESVCTLLHEGDLCHEAAIYRTLQRAYQIYGLQPFLHSIVIPFLQEVEKRRNQGHWRKDQAMLASVVVRDVLIQIRRNFPCHEHAPLLLGACFPQEQHENWLQIILLESLLYGWKTIMLERISAFDVIESAVQQLTPKKVVLSAYTTASLEQNSDLLTKCHHVAKHYPHISFYIVSPDTTSYIQEGTAPNLQMTDDIFSLVKDR
jgi:MerR family transcriptional regulator, light-induced transcriptional regulator